MQPYPQIFTSDLLTAAGTAPLTCPTGQLGFCQNPSVVPYSVYRATGSTYASPKSLSSVCKVKRCYCKENCSSTTAQQMSIFTNSSSRKLQELTFHPRPWANLKSQPFHTFLDVHLIYRLWHLCLNQPILSDPQSLSPNSFLTYNLIFIFISGFTPDTTKS